MSNGIQKCNERASHHDGEFAWLLGGNDLVHGIKEVLSLATPTCEAASRSNQEARSELPLVFAVTLSRSRGQARLRRAVLGLARP